MSRFVNPIPQYVDTDGAPLSGGQLFFFITETTTEKDTFEDSALTTKNANPVILDTSGTIPSIFLEDDVAYRLRILRANDSLFQEEDDVTGLGGSSAAPDHTWVNTITYNIPDDVVRSARWYQSLTNGNIDKDPLVNPGNWTEYTKLKIWNTSETYILDFVVQLNGILYSSRIASNTGHDPESSPTQWANLSGIGLQTIFFPAGALYARLTNGATANTTQPTNTKTINSFDFDPSTVEFVQLEVEMPNSWNGGQIQVRLSWIADTASTNSVVWNVQGSSIASGETENVVFEGAVAVTQANGGDTIRNVTNDIPLTISTAAADELITLQISRDATNGSDDLAVDARLRSVRIHYTTTSSAD